MQPIHFSARLSQKDETQLRAMLREIPQVGEEGAKLFNAALSRKVENAKPQNEIVKSEMVRMIPEVMRDVSRRLWHSFKLKKQGVEQVLFVEWLKFDKAEDVQKQIDIRRECADSGKCPVMEMYTPTDKDLLTVVRQSF